MKAVWRLLGLLLGIPLLLMSTGYAGVLFLYPAVLVLFWVAYRSLVDVLIAGGWTRLPPFSAVVYFASLYGPAGAPLAVLVAKADFLRNSSPTIQMLTTILELGVLAFVVAAGPSWVLRRRDVGGILTGLALVAGMSFLALLPWLTTPAALVELSRRPEWRPVEALLFLGADPEAKDVVGETPLHSAVCGEGPRRTVELLLASGAQTERAGLAAGLCYQQGGIPALDAAFLGRTDVLDVLLRAGAARRPQLLDAAARGEQWALVDRLLDDGVSAEGLQLFEIAASSAPPERLLHLDHRLPGLERSDALVAAIQVGHAANVLTLLLRGLPLNRISPRGGWLPLVEAARVQHEVAKAQWSVPWLLVAGADPNAADGHGETALVVAVENACTWPEAFRPLVSLLLDRTRNLEARNEAGSTALGIAAQCGEREMVKQLLKMGADVRAKDIEGLRDASPERAAIRELLIEHASKQRPPSGK